MKTKVLIVALAVTAMACGNKGAGGTGGGSGGSTGGGGGHAGGAGGGTAGGHAGGSGGGTGGGSRAHTEDIALTVAKLDDAGPANNKDTEPNDAADAGQVGKIRLAGGANVGGFANAYGGLDTGTDVDVYKFTMPTGVQQFSIDLA